MIALLKLQEAISAGDPIDPRDLDDGYAKLYDEPNGGKRYSFQKIINGEVQALAIFGFEGSVEGLSCYSVGYAVKENHRGRGLAVEAVNKGIEELKSKFSQTGMKSFFLEALIAEKNIHSIRVAEKLFPSPGIKAVDCYSGTPSLYFRRLVATG